MSGISRRKLITTGIAAAAGVAGLESLIAWRRVRAGSARSRRNLGSRRNPDLRFAAHAHEALIGSRVYSGQDLEASVRERTCAPSEEFKRLQAGRFADWRLSIDGMVARPASFSLDQLKSYPAHSQITMLQCEEGWSYIAEWIGVLSHNPAGGGSPPASQVCCLLLDRARLVG